MKKIIQFIIILIYRLLCITIPVKKDVILFESSVGRAYAGNPKYIYEELVKRGYDKNRYHCIWSLNDPKTPMPGNCIKIKRMGVKYIYYLAVSGFWIFDGRHPRFFRKRRSTYYIQTWHGTPLKKLALDLQVLDMGGNKDIDMYKYYFRQNVKQWDCLLSQNEYSTNIFRKAFEYNGLILQVGYPRNDILVNENNTPTISIYKRKYAVPAEKKIILYAPTWRDNQYNQKGNYKFIVPFNIKNLYSKIGSNSVLLIKKHYLVDDKLDIEAPEFLFQFDSNTDIQELLLISDILITDYSSVMFDYSILDRPIIYYVHDIEEYQHQLRGFYFDLEQYAPGPIIKSEEQLCSLLERLVNDESNLIKFKSSYHKKLEEFRRKFNHEDSGSSSNKVIEFINEKYIER